MVGGGVNILEIFQVYLRYKRILTLKSNTYMYIGITTIIPFCLSFSFAITFIFF